MSDATRQEIFAQAARKLRQDFEELSTVPHNALKGHEAEKLLRTFLGQHLPKRFGVGAGFVIDPFDQVSRQTDVLIFDALNCPVYRASEDAAIFPNENVAAVIEVKSTLDGDGVADAAAKIAAAKSLAKRHDPGENHSPFTATTTGCVFAFRSPLTLGKLAEHYRASVDKHSLGRNIDFLVVLDKGMVTLSALLPGASTWAMMMFRGLGGPEGEGTHLAVSSHAFGVDTLDAFLRLLLSALSMFRAPMAHPGFDWRKTASGGSAELRYLCSLTHETNLERRAETLRRYAAEAIESFKQTPVPPEPESL